MFGKKTLFSDTVEILSSVLVEHLKLQAALDFTTPRENFDVTILYMKKDDPTVQKLSKKLASAWMTTLPNEALKYCSPGIIAAYILVAEATVYLGTGSNKISDDYVEMARKTLTQTLPDYGFLNGPLLAGEPDPSNKERYKRFHQVQTDFQLFLTTARLAAEYADKGMESFFSKGAEELAKDLADTYFEKGKVPPFWLFPKQSKSL